jgi:hypothetical protein
MDLNTPYSQMLSLMLCVVEINSKKKVMIKAIIPIIPTITVNELSIPFKPSKIEATSITTPY